MYFKNIKGHGEVLSLLKKQLTEGTFDGVHLFAGPRAAGKFTIARELGRYLTCIGTFDDSCRCENCRQYPHVPDYLEVSKEDEIIKVADAEEIGGFLSLVPYRSRQRVVVIDNADRLNTTASNNLLKIVEDSNGSPIVILVTSRPEAIIPPLLSRTMKTRFRPLAGDDVLEVLKAQGHISNRMDDYRRMVPYLSESGITEYPRYMEQVKAIPGFLKQFPHMEEDELLNTINTTDQEGKLIYFIEVLIIYLNDMLKIKYDSPDVVTNIKELDNLEELTVVWNDLLCMLAADKLKGVMLDHGRGLNLKLRHLLTPAMMWIYMFMQKEQQKRAKVEGK